MRFFSMCVLALIVAAKSLSAAEPPIVAIATAPDGETVLTGSNRGVDIHKHSDLIFGERYDLEFANVHDLAFSSDGTSLAIAGGNPAEVGIIKILTWPEKKQISRLKQHTDVVFDVAWSSDGKQIISGGLDQQVLLWNVEQGTVDKKFIGHSKGVTSVCLLDQQQLLVSAGLDQSLRVWDLSTGELVRTLDNHTAAINDLALRPSDEGLPMVVSCGNDRTLRFWQPSIGRLVRFAQLDEIPLAAVWLPGKPQVAVATTKGNILIVDAETTDVTSRIEVDDERLYSLEISNDGTTFFAGNRRGFLERVVAQKEK
ncbi:MAG: WD40 repeat domain-containing protein [Planctomycetaceae bacterium]|nr:WD40 repeat domain-containing protein [Planctomycetaceae bacterium]